MSDHARQHLLEVRELKTYFQTFDGIALAVNDVSFTLDKGETLGIVGESGCGKSVTARSIMRLIKDPPGKIAHGEIVFDGINLLQLSEKQMKAIRGNRISMIFQEPMTSLNPVYTIGNQIAEMYMAHQQLGKRESWERVVDILRKVHIPAPEKRAREYPHQLSGGMRQRAMIAMALSCDPEILIADEPTTALDVTIQAQILDLILQLKQDVEASIIMITHDLGVIAEITQRVIVIYAGKVVEEGRTLSIFEDPKHPYTRGLLKSIPKIGQRTQHGRKKLQEITGNVPSLYELPPGCSFHPRCPQVMPRCKEHVPPLFTSDDTQQVRCWLYADATS
ncbi:ATP-binding cassette domain-containing protein [candidate division KSB3 bacterium]|uniref:ATP-binding cassette domain-containing protein n=1 Tax=candidate division KSB3 bacterium TaxID=2044937 RepID=A0A9D5JTC4_9BACT|nr:ATP-binding cassette domain-containing protein [candidate division KSB3 bacterium]MBD3323889.1 ATP-binding cassette domain-containing protein [candidate division KSB3 bacterium]